MAGNSGSIIQDGVVSADIGDLNGDGYEELVLGNILDNTNGTSAGAAFVFEGGAAEFPSALAYSHALSGMYGNAGDQLGIVTVGDMDANGLEDVVVASLNRGEANLFYGPINSDTQVGDASAHIAGYNDGICFWPTSLGDIDQDGSSDLIVACAESAVGLQILLGTPM